MWIFLLLAFMQWSEDKHCSYVLQRTIKRHLHLSGTLNSRDWRSSTTAANGYKYSNETEIYTFNIVIIIDIIMLCNFVDILKLVRSDGMSRQTQIIIIHWMHFLPNLHASWCFFLLSVCLFSFIHHEHP